ncbi:3-oxoacyl-[acyl-carrier protein] reductase [Mycobacterium frederiksbergense]|uniref:3-oxoacyl-[acyl-carrier protein] reductase n=1 Tax=Mycolicibacterium frederiksbergense TaxID=117567 RepID=A0ABT6L6U7_9MYCO|nr:SDR family oxidoreductase [Mycolicibacterium frederiksbergense]MDH6198649.1 3-oxoacyl-[acyl-carrier protein] reductase [Mycolicibacterium frederiksbergense]
MQPAATTRIVLVTGASRGIGAEVAQLVAGPDTHVVVNYRERAKRADTVADAIRSSGGHASTIGADIYDEAAVAAMIDQVAREFGRLDVLVLNASGGPELGTDPGDAMRLNREAQRRLAQLALPLMPAGGHIVFVTSHQAHFFPNKAVPKGYASVAASKRAGETALYAMRSEFDHRGIHFTVVSGEVDSDGEEATAIANAASAPHPSGIVYVGIPDYLTRLSA